MILGLARLQFGPAFPQTRHRSRGSTSPALQPAARVRWVWISLIFLTLVIDKSQQARPRSLCRPLDQLSLYGFATLLPWKCHGLPRLSCVRKTRTGRQLDSPKSHPGHIGIPIALESDEFDDFGGYPRHTWINGQPPVSNRISPPAPFYAGSRWLPPGWLPNGGASRSGSTFQLR